ncbi:ParB/Srx family N-terminal domain-containing protein [Flammeovirga sp. SJP92]|uniref:ParB/Srx family N-terminal domain-containing protein n=1 Tax=Flammeovirga sp. SJP92 TaxID=1775430 RepID=UPI000788EF67|nr:ParB/Srx family N-terminal domain-containing protein [Flammeovirga sp. SJP92]KXX72735.1 hypothetical protein AVL50_32055 [Flammeovirga sp. SJP92]
MSGKTNLLSGRKKRDKSSSLDLLNTAKENELAQDASKIEYINKSDITVLDELKKYIRKQQEKEAEYFIKSIQEDGVRDPLYITDVVGYGKNILVDGHHRYDATQQKELPINRLVFSSLDEVKIWMLKNQLGRRNLSDAEKFNIAEQLASEFAEQAKENQKSGGNKKGEGKRTREKIAEISGLSGTNYQKYKKVKKEGDPEIVDQMVNNEMSIHKAYTITNEKIKEEQKKNELKETKPKKEELNKEEHKKWTETIAFQQILTGLWYNDLSNHAYPFIEKMSTPPQQYCYRNVRIRNYKNDKNRYGKPKPKANDIDAVSLVKPYYSATLDRFTVAFEIKVSKSDLINDTKFTSYIGWTNYFFFAVPEKLIPFAKDKIKEMLYPNEKNKVGIYNLDNDQLVLIPEVQEVSEKFKSELFMELLDKQNFKSAEGQ